MKKIYPNDICPCGSGKKYKKCCGNKIDSVEFKGAVETVMPTYVQSNPPQQLTYGNEGFTEIRDFLEQHSDKDYTLSIYNIASEQTIEIICDFKDMLDVICYVSNIEHDFPNWIGDNAISESFVVGINFTKGHFKTPAIYEWKNGNLELKCLL